MVLYQWDDENESWERIKSGNRKQYAQKTIFGDTLTPREFAFARKYGFDSVNEALK